MKFLRRLRFRGYGPVWGLVGSMVVVGALILIWGIDWSGPDTTPPKPVATSVAGTVAWNGGDCIDLERWTGSYWDRIAYANYRDARSGVWGPPTSGGRFCNLVGIVNGSVTLPDDADPATYRVCNIESVPDCVDFVFDPSRATEAASSS